MILVLGVDRWPMKRSVRILIFTSIVGIILNVFFCFAILLAVNIPVNERYQTVLLSPDPAKAAVIEKKVNGICAQMNRQLVQFSVSNYALPLTFAAFLGACLFECVLALLQRRERCVSK